MTSEIETLAKRLTQLERENRRLKLIGLGIVVALGAFLSTGAAKTPRTIEAEKFVLRDSHGHARLTIGTPKFAGVAFFSEPDEPIIWLTDENGADRATLTIDGLRFGNGHLKPLVELTSDPRPGRSQLRFYGPDGKIAWSAPDN